MVEPFLPTACSYAITTSASTAPLMCVWSLGGCMSRFVMNNVHIIWDLKIIIHTRSPQFSLFCLFCHPAVLFVFGHMFNETFLDEYTYGWLTKLQALLSNQTRFVCSLWDNVGQLPWQLEVGLIFILCVDLWVWIAWKPWREFFATCPWAQNTVFLLCMCAFCINIGLSGTLLGRSMEGRHPWFGFFLSRIKADFFGNVFWHTLWRRMWMKNMQPAFTVFGISWLYCDAAQ